MPGKLLKYVPFIPQTERDDLFGSIVLVLAHPRGTPIREGVIQGSYQSIEYD